MKQIRFLPLVALAAATLLALKLAGFMLGEKDLLLGSRAGMAAADASAGPSTTSSSSPAKSGSKGKEGGKAAAADANDKQAGRKKKLPPRDIKALTGEDGGGAGEKLLASLAQRRKQLDARENRLSLRLNLLKAAQKRIDERLAQLRGLQARIEEHEKKRQQRKREKFQRLVKMYAAMKPKDAARIFNQLDNRILLGIAGTMKPQAMSAILARMNPQRAREVTMAMAGAGAGGADDEGAAGSLPMIRGK